MEELHGADYWHPGAFDYNTINCSVIHADQHGLYFRPGNPNQAIVVNDGGVAYASSLSDADTNDRFTENERGMITTQFYTVAQSGLDFPGNDYIIGGTQDNGSYALINSVKNQNLEVLICKVETEQKVFSIRLVVILHY